MEREIVFFAEGAEFVDAGWVGGGVKFGSDDDHGFFGEGFAEGAEFAGDNFEGVNWIGVGGVARINEMDEEARALDVLQEANAEPSALVCAFDEAGKIGDDEGAAEFGAVAAGAAVGVDDAEIRFERGERIVGDFGARGGDDGDERGSSGVGKTDEADIGEEF